MAAAEATTQQLLKQLKPEGAYSDQQKEERSAAFEAAEQLAAIATASLGRRCEADQALEAAATTVGAEIEKGYDMGDYQLDDDTPLPPVPAALSAEYATLPGDVDAMYR